MCYNENRKFNRGTAKKWGQRGEKPFNRWRFCLCQHEKKPIIAETTSKVLESCSKEVKTS